MQPGVLDWLGKCGLVLEPVLVYSSPDKKPEGVLDNPFTTSQSARNG